MIEKEVKIEQSKLNNLNFNIGIGKEIPEKLNYQEQIWYKLICCLIYIYSMWKRVDFDIDKSMRGKLVWEKHYRKIESSIKSLGWNCLYLVSSHIIIKWLKNDRFRSRISTEQIMKYFKREGSFEELALREDKKRSI